MGATFDSCIRSANEDVGTSTSNSRSSKRYQSQMLLRGQNVGYPRNYADDVVRLFIENLYKMESEHYSCIRCAS